MLVVMMQSISLTDRAGSSLAPIGALVSLSTLVSAKGGFLTTHTCVVE